MELGEEDTSIVDEVEEVEPASEDSAFEDSAFVIDPYCMEGMVSVRDEQDEPVYCVDRFEMLIEGEEWGNKDQGTDWPDGSTLAIATTEYGVYPSTHFSWYQAVALCQNAGKYLCSTQEWVDACDGVYGAGGTKFPYGNEWISGECAARFGNEAQIYEGAQLTGDHEGCVSPWGMYDLIGNVWEWSDPMTEDEEGRPYTHKIGASYYSGGGNLECGKTPVNNHPPEFTGIIGARCCASPVYPN